MHRLGFPPLMIPVRPTGGGKTIYSGVGCGGSGLEAHLP
jgi:hypothetical protein